MKGTMLLCAVLSLAAARPVYAGPVAENGCCACLGSTIEASAPTTDGRRLTPAVFCATPANDQELDAAGAKCEALTSMKLECFARVVGDPRSCGKVLLDQGILCPGGVHAPALGRLGLGGLAGLLILLGAVVLRRRAAHTAR